MVTSLRIGKLEKLGNLGLYRNFLTGTLPPELGNMKRLFDFRVQRNSLLGGDIPENFSDCNFTGTVSSMVGNLKSLSNFLINENSFTGTIPVELTIATFDWRDGGLGSSKILGNARLQNNNFHGEIPQEFCQLHLDNLVADCAPDPATGVAEFQCDCCTECCDAGGTCTLTKDPTTEWEG
jgi:hypothetical protein